MRNPRVLIQTAMVFPLVLPLLTACIGVRDEDLARRAQEEGITEKEAKKRQFEAFNRMEDFIPVPREGGE